MYHNNRFLSSDYHCLNVLAIIAKHVIICKHIHIVRMIATLSALSSSSNALMPIALHQYFHISVLALCRNLSLFPHMHDTQAHAFHS